MKKVFCVISHTHWDREWYAPLELFRNRLTDLFDRLLIILEKNPDYVFHMDAQTVVLEDYLAVRPEKKAILMQHIKNRRIIVGPWYLQNDFYLTSGESTVRNLLEGKKLTTEFGASGGIGYAPDQFGNISQLPQILDNFGIHNFVFGRGFSEYYRDAEGKVQRKPSPTEFIWKGADGTEALAIHMRHWYNNAQRFSADIDKAYKYVESIAACFDNEFTFTPYLLLMNGVDHLEPQADLLPILEEVQKKLPEDEAIMQYNMDDYVKAVDKFVKENDIKLPVHENELRSGHDWEILKGTLSSRHYLKVANVKAQTLLENVLEPLYSMLEKDGMNGFYPYDRLIYTWKNLLRNHPHDSSCGCSRDEVHYHMENRYSEIFEYGNDLLRRGMIAAANHSKVLREASLDDYVITVANTLSSEFDGMTYAELTFIRGDEINNFEIFDEQGNKVDFIATRKYDDYIDVFSPINLPGTIDVTKYDIYMKTGKITPFSFKNFLVKKTCGDMEITPAKCCDCPEIENEYFKVAVDEKGKITLTEKASGRVIDDVLKFEDVADAGESYVFVTGKNDTPILSDGTATSVEVLEKNEYVGRIKVSDDLLLPVDYDKQAEKRTDEKVVSKASLEIILRKDEKFVGVKYAVDNKSKSHRTRVLVSTDATSDVSTADIPYDVVTHGEEAHYIETYSKVLPNTSFASINQNGKGFAVFTNGAHEYEHMDGNKLAFSIIRATGLISESVTETWRVPGNQCIRLIEGELALCPFEGDVFSAGILQLVQRFRAPVSVCHTSCDTRKFEGGRPCVQDSELHEFFYLPDAYPKASIPSNIPALSVEGDGIQVSAFKRSEDGSGLVVRFVNLSDKETEAAVKFDGKIFMTDMTEIPREFIGFNSHVFKVGKKKIVTLYLGK